MFTASLLILGGQIMTLFFQLGNYFMRSFDATRLRFLRLTIAFVLLNIAWLLNWKSSLHFSPLYEQSVFMVFGIIIGVMFYRHLRAEKLVIENRIIHKKTILISSLALSLIVALSFGIYFFTEISLTLAILFGCSITVVSFVWWQVITSFFYSRTSNKSVSSKVFFIGHYLGLILIAFSPFGFSVADQPMIGVILANCAFVALAFAYFSYLFRQGFVENKFLNNLAQYPSAIDRETVFALASELNQLTDMEKVIAYHILRGFKHKEIAQLLSISTSTVTSHATHIYKKTNCPGKKDEFREKFKGLSSFLS